MTPKPAWRRYWVSVADWHGSDGTRSGERAMTVKVDVDEKGIVRETYTAFPGLRGVPWPEFLAELRAQYGAELIVEDL
jgi:hypothetical protein